MMRRSHADLCLVSFLALTQLSWEHDAYEEEREVP